MVTQQFLGQVSFNEYDTNCRDVDSNINIKLIDLWLVIMYKIMGCNNEITGKDFR